MGLIGRLCLLLAALVAAPAAAQTFPPFTGLVVDAANVLPPAEEQALTQRLQALQDRTQNQLVVVTVPDLEGYPIEDYGYRLGREWGVGLRNVDNGAVLIVAPNDRKVRIEVGRGLEPVVTDALSSVIVNQTILPRFRAGDLPGGIVAGADALAEQIGAPEADQQRRIAEAGAAYERRGASRGGGAPNWIAVVFWVVIFFVVIGAMAGRGGKRRGRRYRRGGAGSVAADVLLWTIASQMGRGGGGGSSGWGGGGGGGWGGGGGGGFTGGGGGSFGGGGASGSW